MHGFFSDLRDAIRTFRVRPVFSLLAVVTLAVGMSVNTVAFSVLNGVLFKVPDFANRDRLAWIFIGSPGNPLGAASLPQYEAFAKNSRTLDAIVAEGRLPLRLADGNRIEQVWALVVSGTYFDVLGVRAETGRLLAGGDAERPVAVVSHQFWTSRLGRAAPGATLVLNDVQFSLVGVLPAGFHGPGGIYAPDVVVSLDARRILGLPARIEAADNDWLTLVAASRRGATPAQVAQELTALLHVEPRSAGGRDNRRVRVAPMKDGDPEARMIARIAGIGMATLSVVLLIACLNVAGLLLARATERRREMAVRASLGASSWRLARQLTTEALLFAASAGALALALSAASGRLLGSFALPSPIPQQIDLSPDSHSVLFTLCMVLVATVLPSLFPARHAARLDLQQVLASESGTTSGGRRSRARRVFQVLQISGATMFLALAALFVGSFRHMLAIDLGFDTRRVLVVSAQPETHGRSAAQAEQLFRSLTERLNRDPFVRRAATASSIPYTFGVPRATRLGVNGQDCRIPRSCESVDLFVVDPGYIDVMAITLLHGRDLVDADRRPSGGILVSRTTAERFWPGKSPVGETVTVGTEGETAQIVGIVSDVRAAGIGRKMVPQAYRAIRTADYGNAVTMVVGTSGDPALIADRVRREAASIDRALPLQSVQPMQEHLKLALWGGRVAAWFMGVCGTVALVLASVGLFGVISYAVAQRLREFGIRMALGANTGTILALVLKEGAVLTAIGTVIGLAVGAAAGAVARSALVGVSAGDPRPYLAAAAIQAVVALAACAYPAIRAACVDPVAVMRQGT